VILGPIDERAVSHWTMGFPRVTSKDLAEIPGLNDFSVKQAHIWKLRRQAKTLLAAFKEGQWRARLS